MRKSIALLLSVAMTLSLFVTTAFASSEFSDLPQDYSTQALEAAVKNGLLKGTDGKLLPSDNLTRAQMAAILVRAFGGSTADSLSAFNDVQSDAWYYAELGQAVHMGLFKGDGSLMNPNSPITRQEAFTVLARAFKLTATDTTGLDKFKDNADIASWAKDSVAAMAAAGFVAGDEKGNVNPNANISRKDFAVTMDRLVKTYVAKAGTVTEVADGSVVVNVAGVTLKDVTIKGNLIIGDGVGDGNVTLENVKVEGLTIVRGGGVNSVVAADKTELGTVLLAKLDGDLRFAVEGNAKVGTIEARDGKQNVIVEGKFTTLNLTGGNVPVTLQKATVGTVNMTAENAKLTVAKGATITTLNAVGKDAALTVAGSITTVNVAKTAEGTQVAAEKGAVISTVNAEAAKTAITGEGTVNTANIKANDAKVNTVGTKVAVDKGVTGVTSNGNSIAGGTTATTTTTTPSNPTTNGNGGGSTTVESYKYTVRMDAMTGGKVTASITDTNQENQTVTLTVKPDNGYKLETLKVMNGDKEVSATKQNDGTYTFVLTAQVKVSATFVSPLKTWDAFVVTEENYAKLTAADKTTYTDAKKADYVGKFAIIAVKADKVTADVKITSAELSILRNGVLVPATEVINTGKTITDTLTAALKTDAGDDLGLTNVSGHYVVTLKYQGATYTGEFDYTAADEKLQTVNFVAGDTTVASYSAVGADTVAVPTADKVPAVAGKQFVGWYTGDQNKTEVKGSTFTVLAPPAGSTTTVTTTITAKYIDVTTQTLAVSGTATTYTSAGLSFAKSEKDVQTINVDQSQLLAVTTPGTLAGATLTTNLVVKLSAAAPTVDGKTITSVAVTTNNANLIAAAAFAADACAVELAFADYANTTVSALPDTTYELVFTWSDANGIVAATQATVKLVTAPVSDYTVTFDTQNGDSTVPAQQVAHGKFIKEPTAPTKKDYVFAGWYTEKECTNVWDVKTATVTKTITLYAKWDDATVDVTDVTGLTTALKTNATTINVKATGNVDLTGPVTVKAGTTLNIAKDASVTLKHAAGSSDPDLIVNGTVNVAGTLIVNTDATVSIPDGKDDIGKMEVTGTLKFVSTPPTAGAVTLTGEKAQLLIGDTQGDIIIGKTGDFELSNDASITVKNVASATEYTLNAGTATVNDSVEAVVTLKVSGDKFTVAEGATLTIAAGKTLALASGASLVNNGTVKGADTAKLDVKTGATVTGVKDNADKDLAAGKTYTWTTTGETSAWKAAD